MPAKRTDKRTPKKRQSVVKSADSETTGMDFYHGCRPFFVSITNQQYEQVFWSWTVDPLTREVEVMEEDLEELEAELDDCDILVFQNPKFDMKALATIKVKLKNGKYRRFNPYKYWPKIRDTLVAGHLLASGEPHDLATMALLRLGPRANIKPLEEVLHKQVNEARRLARKYFPDWRIATPGDPMIPSVRGSASTSTRGNEVASYWKIDSWLLNTLNNIEIKQLKKEIAEVDIRKKIRSWKNTLPDYGNGDSAVTLPLYLSQRTELEERGLWDMYLERMKLLPITFQMEQVGVTLNRKRTNELANQFQEESDYSSRICLKLSEGHLTRVPKGVSNELKDTLFNHFKLPAIEKSKKTQEPSTDKNSMDAWSVMLKPNSKAGRFIHHLAAKRKRDTAINYMQGYHKMALPLPVYGDDWLLLHPSFNVTGTDTLRFSSSDPNAQNISKQEGFNLRYCFGPAPGREWWSIDYDNIELRIPAYEAPEPEMVELFEQPDKPPYYGSYHSLVCHILHKDKFEECLREGVAFKDKYKATWYQWVKNGNFATSYGAVEESGTADAAYHVKGGQRKIKSRFFNLTKLSDHYVQFANEHGFVETVPDKRFGHGYPIQTVSKGWGGVKPTIPFNYHVQGTAMWCMCSAMVRCHNFLQQWNASHNIHTINALNDYTYHNKPLRGAHMIMQVHDEIVFDLPKGGKKNLELVYELQRLMELSGDDIGVPLKASIDYHPVSWDKTQNDLVFSA